MVNDLNASEFGREATEQIVKRRGEGGFDHPLWNEATQTVKGGFGMDIDPRGKPLAREVLDKIEYEKRGEKLPEGFEAWQWEELKAAKAREKAEEERRANTPIQWASPELIKAAKENELIDGLLGEAQQNYMMKNTPLGDHAAAKWLIRHRSVKTDSRGRIYAYNAQKGHYEREGELLLKADLLRVFGAAANRTRIGEILARVAALSHADDETLTSTTPPNLIPFQNGVYDLSTGQLLPHSPEYFFTYVHPVKYDKTAVCQAIDRFLNTSVAPRDKELLLDIVALCLYRDRVTRNFYVLVGKGHNGKSLYLGTTRALLGESRVVSITPQALSVDVFAPAQLYDKHANLGADIPGGLIQDATIIKSATGGDTVSVQRKGVDRDERKIYCEFVWGSNDPPRISEDTHAIWDRLIVISFPYTFVPNPQKENERQAIKDLDKQLIAPGELSGLLNLALERLPRLVENRALSVPVDSEATRKQYRTLSDTPAVFVDEACEEVDYEPSDSHTPSSGYLTMEEAYRAYKQWCKENKVTPVSSNRFGRAMEKMGFERGKDNGVKTYRGIKINDSWTVSTDSPYSTHTQGGSKEKNRENRGKRCEQSELSVTEEDITEEPSLIVDTAPPVTDECSLLDFLRRGGVAVPRDTILGIVHESVGNYTDRGFWLDVTLRKLEKEARALKIGADSWTALE